ncbi:glycosyltransferase family A protein [Flavobacterium faecale]|uniref:glycosyltransferase family A protein n=1 Tax=Flavobacterium faecale TaxID=1355330 RepID=UPI003AB0707B
MNPQKQERKIEPSTKHRIIVVVYIPNEEGFYKDSFDVFKLSLDSLICTINSYAAITIVNNGSHERVSNFLQLYLAEKKIDTLISHNTNIGKIDALIGAARGAREKQITLADSDILFVKGWQEKVEEIFSAFPNVGSVSPIPIRKGLYASTSSVLKEIVFRRLKFSFIPIVENYKDYNRFLESINWGIEKNEDEKWPVVEKKGIKAVIGSAHQVLTIDRDILFTTTPSNPSFTLVGNDSEHNYVDIPIDMAGKLRLSTFNNYAFHIGNHLESWMNDVQLDNLKKENHIYERIVTPSSDLFNSKYKFKWYNLKKMIIKKFFALCIIKNPYH